MKLFLSWHKLLFILLNVFTLNCYAWDHSVEFGYGISHDPRHTKLYNSGFLLSSDILKLKRTPHLFWSLNGAVGRWYSTAKYNKYLRTAALGVGLRYYPFTSMSDYPSYLLGTVGPAYLSSRHYGSNTQAGNFAFQFNAGLGVEIKKIDVNLRLVHFSNAYIAKPDQGFTILYLLSLGYLF